VDLRVVFAEEVLDANHDGLLSMPEVIEGLGPGPKAGISALDLIDNSTGVLLWRPQWNPDGDDFVDIEEEFESFLVRLIDYAMTAEYTGSKLVQSQLALESNIDMIGNVTSSILILQGENDILTPLEDALLLEQRLTEIGHPDHTLVTYPGLGHYFYPEDYWSIAMGPMQDYMLRDLEAWLKEPARKVYRLDSQLQTAEKSVEELQGRLDELYSELDQNINELEDRNVELESELDSVKKLAYISLGVAIMVSAAVAIVLFQRRR